MKRIVGVKKRGLGDSWTTKKRKPFKTSAKYKEDEKIVKGELLFFDNSATLKTYKNKY